MKHPDLCVRKCFSLCSHGFILSVLNALCVTGTSEKLFIPGKEYVYSYDASSSTGVFLPDSAESVWSFHGKLVIQADQEDSVLMQLQSLKTSAWNGPSNQGTRESIDISDEALEMLNPFRVWYRLGRVENISVETEPAWATNIKQSIAGILQLDISNIHQDLTSAFHSIETNHYGECNIEYVVMPQSADEKSILKSVDPRTCKGHGIRTWSNVPDMSCPNNDQNPVMKSSERFYEMKISDDADTIEFVNATGGIFVQPFQSLGEAQFLYARQVFRLLSINEVTEVIPTKRMNTFPLHHYLPEDDVSMLRNVPLKSEILRPIERLLEKLSQRLENPGLDVEVENLHNTTIADLLYYMGMLERMDLQNLHDQISGTSYKEETIMNLFLEALPQVGSKDAALFILDLIQQKKVSNIVAVQLLTYLPFHIRKPDVELLVDLQAFLNLPDSIASEVQNTAILTYGTLIYKTCLLYCPYEMLDDYVRLYLDKFTESRQYEKKMVWLEGLSNIQLGKVVEFLEPIARGDSTKSRHLRFLAAWASLPSAPLRPDVIHPVYWPILVNRTEHLELRVAAMTLLIVSSPSLSRLISLYWYMQGEPDQHLYNFFYTTLKSMEQTNFPCYTRIGQFAAQFTRMLRKPSNKKLLVTGNYVLDYQDTYRHFGSMLQTIIIGNPVSNVPTVAYVTLNNHGAGISSNQLALYIKADSALEKIAPIKESGDIMEVLKQFKIKENPEKPVHVEIIAQIQGKAVLCLHLNETNIKKGYKFLMDLTEYAYIFQNMAFHINQQRINVPLTMESVQVTDLGTNARIFATATSMFSMRGDFIYTPHGRNNHIVLRTSTHGVEGIESYNPLTDLWHVAQRARSIHAYLPVNITVGKMFFSYITPKEHVTTGITAHVRTTTSIRGPLLNSKLSSMCANCQAIYTARNHPNSNLQGLKAFDLTAPELGSQLNVKLFDCDSRVSPHRLVDDIMASHRSNYQIWPVLKSGILIFHFMDYFTYVPPGGTCGIAAHAKLYDLQPTEVKVEYVNDVIGKQRRISLTRGLIGSRDFLQEWKIIITHDTLNSFANGVQIKATRTEKGQKPWLMHISAGSLLPSTPSRRSLLNNTPSGISSMELNMTWGTGDVNEVKSKGSLLQVILRGKLSNDQITESKSKVWPYEKCRQESLGKNFVPYTEACYEASRELSTLREYHALVTYENLTGALSEAVLELRTFYDLMDFDKSRADLSQSDKLFINAIFPKGSNRPLLYVNKVQLPVYELENLSIIESILMRTRSHEYWDNPISTNFFSTCLVTATFLRATNNVSALFPQDEETLLLGHCRSSKPTFAVTSKTDSANLTLTLYDSSDRIKIVPEGGHEAVYNHSEKLLFERNYVSRNVNGKEIRSYIFNDMNGKKIRMGENMVELVYVDIALFVYWTPEQIVLLYPDYVQEFSCGLCAKHTDEARILG
ncbi:uncharacterized protein LOC124186103 isoform X1 [Neodiprion fabricii]|uniref:uncharacterized protein LOC124186103 isoform X1 n=1 Tax=Neodiprion fabricii TaxID=2872261 RepID=UPI001ED95C13|nr:uncharacterized protein LOC124186103 isoform X1 [Neodiprion fabricii]XP_046433451.1 uncharacterized protein LOC124186103 isoform X1 [Neodiprion fabricii]